MRLCIFYAFFENPKICKKLIYDVLLCIKTTEVYFPAKQEIDDNKFVSIVYHLFQNI